MRLSNQPSAVSLHQEELPDDLQTPLSENQQPITDNHSAIYLAPFYYAELGVANQFSRLLASQEAKSRSVAP